MRTIGLRYLRAAVVLCVPGCFGPQPPDRLADTGLAATGTQGGETGESSETSGGVEGDTQASVDEGSSGADIELRNARLQIDGLGTLSGGFHYELWAIIDNFAATVGKFNVDGGQVVVDLRGIAVPDATFDAGRDLRTATSFVVTIETAGDVDITPGVSKYVAGPLEDGQSLMVVQSSQTLGDYSGASGQFILATPTDSTDVTEEAGVWWLDLSVEPPAPGLMLPELPEGWEYEGWAVIDGTPVSTGRFRDVNAADFGNPFSGLERGPMVPGEDLLDNAPKGLEFPADLRGQSVVVTIEPEPDFDDGPFTLRPLTADVDPMAATMQSMSMTLQIETFPTATVVLVE